MECVRMVVVTLNSDEQLQRYEEWKRKQSYVHLPKIRRLHVQRTISLKLLVVFQYKYYHTKALDDGFQMVSF